MYIIRSSSISKCYTLRALDGRSVRAVLLTKGNVSGYCGVHLKVSVQDILLGVFFNGVRYNKYLQTRDSEILIQLYIYKSIYLIFIIRS